MSLLLYAIVGADTSPSDLDTSLPNLETNFTSDLQVIEQGALAALCGESRGSYSDTSLQDLQGFQSVVMAIHDKHKLVPVRFGTMLPNAQVVQHHLAQHQVRYLSLLRELDACVEMSVRIALPESVDGGPIPESEQGTSGKAFLGSRRNYYAAVDRQEQTAKQLLAECNTAFAGRYRQLRNELSLSQHRIFQVPLLSVFLLIKRTAVTDIRRCFEIFSANRAEHMSLSGPWPPYSFVEEEDGTKTPFSGKFAY